MKVLFVHQGFELYGSDRMLLIIINVFKKVFTKALIDVNIPRKGNLSQEIEAQELGNLIVRDFGVLRKAEIFRFNLKVFYYITLGLVYSYRRIRKYDYVYVNSIVIIDYLILSIFVKKKFIIHVHEIPVGFQGIFFKFLLNYSRASIICVSTEVQRFFKKKKMFVVPNGSIQFKCQVKSIEEHINILLIGRLNHQKGQLFFLKAFSTIPDDVKVRFRVRIVGDVFDNQDYYRSELIEYVRAFNLESFIEFYPFDANPLWHYDWAHVVCVPSTKPESFGLVAVEGMSAGCALLVANIGGLLDIVEDGVSGFFFKANDLTDLAKSIILLWEKNKELVEVGLNGKCAFNEKFSIEAFSTKLGVIIKKIVN